MSPAARLIAAALALSRSHATAPVLEVLDLVLGGAGPVAFLTEQVHPASGFGQLLAAAFDRGNTPAEWAAWTRPPADPVFVAALLTIWRDEVLRGFAARYGVLVR